MNAMTHDTAIAGIRKQTQQTYIRFDYARHRERLQEDISRLGRQDAMAITAALKAEINRIAKDIRTTRAAARAAHRAASLGTGSLGAAITLQGRLREMKVEAHNAIQMRLAFKDWSRVEYRKRQEWLAERRAAEDKAKEATPVTLQDTPAQREFARLILERIQPAIEQMQLKDVAVRETGLEIEWECDQYARGCHIGTQREVSTLTWADILSDTTPTDILLERNRVKNAA